MNQKMKYITGIALSALVICALTIPAFALTESDVQSQVSASGKEGVAGNLFVWFLCAVAFLKISQKIDSNGAYRSATGTGSGGVGGMAFRASMTKGGDIANNVISRVATGRPGTGEVMSGNMAADALYTFILADTKLAHRLIADAVSRLAPLADSRAAPSHFGNDTSL